MLKSRGKGSRQTPKKCVKATAFPCKNTCLPRKQPSGKDTNCRNPLKGQAATAVLWITDQQKRLDQINKNRSQRGVSLARLDKAGYIVTDKMARTGDVGKAINKQSTKLTSYLKEGGMTPISYDDWKDNIRAIKGANDNYTLQGYGATEHNINTWGSTEGNIKKAYFLSLVDNRTIDPIGDLPKLLEKTDRDRQINDWAKSVAYSVESRRKREKAIAKPEPEKTPTIIKSSVADDIIKQAKVIDPSELKKGQVVKFARFGYMQPDDTMDLTEITVKIVSSDGKKVRARFENAANKSIFTLTKSDGDFYPVNSMPNLAEYLREARKGIDKLPFLRTEYEGLEKQWQALNKGLPAYGSPNYASLRAKFDQVDSSLRSVSSEINKFESYSRKATQALQSHLDSLPKEDLQKQEDSDKAIAALEDLAKLRVDDTQPTPVINETEASKQKSRDIFASLPSTKLAAAKYLGINPNEIEKLGSIYMISIPPEKRNNLANQRGFKASSGKTIKQAVFNYIRYTDPTWTGSHDLYQAGIEDVDGNLIKRDGKQVFLSNPANTKYKIPEDAQKLISPKQSKRITKQSSSDHRVQHPKNIKVDGINYDVVEYIPLSKDELPSLYNRGVRGSYVVKNPRSSKLWQVYHFEDGRYSKTTPT